MNGGSGESPEKVEVSVARYLRTPPEGANPQGLIRDYRAALSSETCLSIVVVCNYKVSPITVVQCRAKVRSLHLRRSYFAPIRSRPKGPSGLWWRRRVPPPGPNGLLHRLFIAIVRQADLPNISIAPPDVKRPTKVRRRTISPDRRQTFTSIAVRYMTATPATKPKMTAGVVSAVRPRPSARMR